MQPSGCPADQAERKFDLPVRKQTGRIWQGREGFLRKETPDLGLALAKLRNYSKFTVEILVFWQENL
ncbi:MAG: hypothetical protein A2908_01025 [Candidatus Staskawiczbacteria bacterium RIFCSPLOWO2_01_FULL_38_12b]|uniref:Uncharacterized protein n=1 Tax=Candidatus Staskawiczbacteria bacterium RIFCSPLOWO2_01_FULL_38_12b TaxID=1802214 RepID=A0A1G2IB76_9BACT|nr:MAG: hypothetical protein A2908_01025 [Candidatus Staskawiczbacteria bacterium RIFCSPLOWO2_01_FULL_38_12b]